MKNKLEYTKICKYKMCEKPYMHNIHNQKYCCVDCRKKAYEARKLREAIQKTWTIPDVKINEGAFEIPTIRQCPPPDIFRKPINDKETIKALRKEIAELKHEKQVFRQLIQDSYKELLKHTKNDDKPRHKEELKDYRPV